MDDKSYTVTLVVDQTPEQVFAAVTNVREWWSADVEGPTDALGAEFTYHYQDVHRCRMRIVEFVPGETVVWHCVENYFSFTEDAAEWVDTRIRFDISEQDGATQLRFTHVGLVPDDECFEVCTNAWGGYVAGSLRSLIVTGHGARNNQVRNAEAQALARPR